MTLPRTYKVAGAIYLVGLIFLTYAFLLSRGRVIADIRNNPEISLTFWGMVILLLGLSLVSYRAGLRRGEEKNKLEILNLQTSLAQKEREIAEMEKELAEIERAVEEKSSQLASVSGRLGERERRLKRIKEILGVG